MLFPKSRISRHSDNGSRGRHVWTYASYEYQVLAYQVDLLNQQIKDRFQIQDEQLLLGASTQRTFATFFAEAGLVFDRHARFRGSTSGFGIHDGVMLRTGAVY